MLENLDKDIYNTFDELDDLLFRTRRYLDPNLIQKYFQLQWYRRNAKKFK